MDQLVVSNLNYSFLLHYCERKKIAPDFLIEGTSLTMAEVSDLKKKSSWDDCSQILENFKKSVPFSEYDEVFKYAAIGKDFDTVSPVVFGYFSPKIPYWALSKFLGKKLFKNVDYSLEVISAKEIIMKITVKQEKEVHPLFFDSYVYIFKYLSLLINRKESQVHISKRGHNTAEYTVLLPKRLSLAKRIGERCRVLAGYRSSVSLVKELNESNDHLESLTNELYISNEIKKNLISEVEHKNDELNKLYTQKTTLLRMLVHDVATPIMIASLSIKSLRKLEEDEGLSEEKKKKFDSITAGLESITTLIREARSLEDISSFGKSYKLEKVDVDRSINYAIELAQAKFPEKKVKIFYISNLRAGTCVNADYQKFSNSVLANILSNAIKFSYDGDCIEVTSLIDASAMVVIAIKDNGIGIPMNIQRDLFKLEMKTSRVGTNGEKGTGYGMPIAKSMIDSLGGEISIESRDINTNPHNHGTTFTIRLIAAEASFILKENSNNFLNVDA